MVRCHLEGENMSITTGVVREGLIVPHAPLPEGARVEIRLLDSAAGSSPELRAEFAAWDGASANALELVERMAREIESDDKR
jgi:hypothetical protein